MVANAVVARVAEVRVVAGEVAAVGLALLGQMLLRVVEVMAVMEQLHL